MAREFYIVLIVLLLTSACVTIVEPQAPTEEAPPSSGTLSETEADLSESAVSEEPAQERSDSVARKTPSREEIRLLQERMKSAGFDVGPADGVLGAKTSLALERLQSACGTLNDLLPQDAPAAPAFAKRAAPDEIRLLQVRLKAAGFDPGPIDGIFGAQTRAKWLAVQSVCAAAKNFPPIANPQTGAPQTSARRAPGAETQPVPRGLKPAGALQKVSMQLHPSATAAPSADEIQLIQIRLQEAGFDPGAIDGVLGPKTKAALRRYRATRGLAAHSSAPFDEIGDMLD